jgi:predicted nucleic acid-binding protein
MKRTNLVLVDSSVWIAVFRRASPFDLEAVASFDEVVTCLPVIQEVLQGFDEEGAFRTARTAMRALPCVESPLSEALVLEAVALYRTARRAGGTPAGDDRPRACYRPAAGHE